MSKSEPKSDPFLTELYDRLHDTPQQRKMKRIHPWPVGCVFIQRPEMGMEEIRAHFKLMKKMGFTALKQCQTNAATDNRKVLHMALDEGLFPWWYGEGGWEEPTPELLKQLGIDPNITIQDLRKNQVWLKRQDKVMRERIDRTDDRESVAAHETDGLPSTLPRAVYGLPEEGADLFVEWLKKKYGTVEALKKAWNFQHTMVRAKDEWQTWEDVRKEAIPFVNKEQQDYRRIVDVFRFKADMHLKKIAAGRDRLLKRDPHEPMRAGGEMSLFLPFAARSTDMEGIAGLMADGGSFYPSIHPNWHFEEVDFEFPRPVYMQAALAVDWMKGGWAGVWECTGGPQALSGGKSPFVEETRSKVAGFTIDGNTIQQLMLSWIAGGFKGTGQWCWNARTFGWEAGDYALLDRNQQPCDRTIAAGKIGQTCRRLRDELWEAHKEPLVGIFQDFEHEAFWGALAIGGRDMYKSFPMRARVGLSRALMNANVPLEHVTARNLRAGLAGRYRVIYLPACLAIDSKLLTLLTDYVKNGGRVVLDAPGAWYDFDGCLLPTADGTIFEQLFGCRIGDYQYSRANHRIWSIGGKPVEGFSLELQLTTAQAVEFFDDAKPSVTEHKLGKGSAVVIGYEASMMCFRPGNAFIEEKLVRHTLGELQSPYACDGAVVYRLAAPKADHYFLINPGPARRVMLDTKEYRYSRAEDAIEQTAHEIGGPIDLAANGARWFRFAK